nr:hypothetical protein Iba_chr10fCG3500 [Ipomoea batatas]
MEPSTIFFLLHHQRLIDNTHHRWSPSIEFTGGEPVAGSPVESSTKEESSRTSSLCHHRRRSSRSPSTTTPPVTRRTQGSRFTINTLVNWSDHRKRSPLREIEDHTADWFRRCLRRCCSVYACHGCRFAANQEAGVSVRLQMVVVSGGYGGLRFGVTVVFSFSLLAGKLVFAGKNGGEDYCALSLEHSCC